MSKNNLPHWVLTLVALVPVLCFIWGIYTWNVARSDKKNEQRENRLNERLGVIEKKIDNLDPRVMKVEIMVDLMNKDLAANETRVFVIRKSLAKLDSIGRTR